MSSKEGANSSREVCFRRAREFDRVRILDFLSEEMYYNIEIITIIENIGLKGKSFSLFLLEEEKTADVQKDRNRGVVATLFVGRDYANLYLAQEVRITRGREILQAAWSLICELFSKSLSKESFEYLYVNDEMELHLDVLPVDHVIVQTICSHPKAEGFEQVNAKDMQNSTADDFQKNESPVEFKIEVLKSGEEVLHSVLALHRECFDSAPCPENYGKLIDYKVMKPYYLQVKDQVISKGEWIVNNRNTAYISGLCTTEAFRNMGFCSILLNRMLMEIGACNRMALLNYEKEELTHFYSKLGFRREYVRRKVWLKI